MMVLLFYFIAHEEKQRVGFVTSRTPRVSHLDCERLAAVDRKRNAS